MRVGSVLSAQLSDSSRRLVVSCHMEGRSHAATSTRRHAERDRTDTGAPAPTSVNLNEAGTGDTWTVGKESAERKVSQKRKKTVASEREGDTQLATAVHR